MNWLEKIFQPPPMPPVDLPFLAKWTPGAKKTLYEAYRLVYYIGMRDIAPWAFLAGIVFTLFVIGVIVGIVLAIRSQAMRPSYMDLLGQP